MADSAAAKRYASALFEVCAQEHALERVEQDVSAFLALLDAHAALRKCLLSPVVPPAVKSAVINAIVARVADVSPITARLLTMLSERGRLGLLPQVLEVYRERLMAHRGQLRARLTTTAPLSDERTRAIAQQIGAATGSEVTVDARVDPGIVGGVVVQIGSTVWDGSLSRHLARLRQRLLADT